MNETVKIKKLFIIAVSLTVMILAANYILLSRFMNSQDHAANMVNVSGKQRMYLQKTALLSEQLVNAKDAESRSNIKQKLNVNIQQMLAAHEELINPDSHIGNVTNSNKDILNIYFKEPHYVDRNIRLLHEHVHMLLKLNEKELSGSNLSYLFIKDSANGKLLNSLDYIVKEYESVNESELRMLNILSIALFIGAIAVVSGMWWFVFRPMIENVRKTMQLMRLQQKVAVAANEADSIKDSLQVAIDGVCDYMKWDVGHVYIYSEDNSRLISMDVWKVSDEKKYAEFMAVSDAMTFAQGEGFIGEVYSDATPMWILDVSMSSVYSRKEIAKQSGLSAAFAFPIFIGRKAVAIMEFYSPESHIPDETILHIMGNIGKQLGQSIERAEFEKKAKLLQTVISSANDGIIISKANGNDINNLEIIYANDAFAKITGYESSEVIGVSPKMLQNAENADLKTLARISMSLKKGIPFKGELPSRSKDGADYWVDVSIVPVKNDDGRITHFAAIQRDITERKQSEQELRETMKQLRRANLKAEAAARDLQESLRKAEEANKAKSDFLANMSHELRTPMNGVLGMAHLLSDTNLSNDQKQLVTTINGSAEHLLMLLNDILDFSKIEAGALILERIPFSFIDVLHHTTNLLRAQSDKKGVDLILEYEPDIPSFIWGDSGRISQIITNLLGNAIKFTDRGYVRLSACVEDCIKGKMLHVSVEDTGMGIPASKIKEIFEKFTQADTSVTRKYGGTGLGLAITKQLVNLMGGNIGVESAEGKGSTFWFNIPLQVADASSVEEHLDRPELLDKNLFNYTRIPIAEAKVLLVEDYRVNQIFAEKLLTKFGFRNIDLAENGVEAIQKYRSKNYDIIFMDCQMPELDGYEATTKIRMIEEGTPIHTTIIAMTANAMVGDREKCLKCGMDDYLSKPLRSEHVRKVLEQHFLLSDENDFIASITTPQISEKELVKKDEEPAVDISQLRMFTDGDAEEEKALAEIFMQQADEMIKILESSTTMNQAETWKSAAHRFKGSSGNLGAMRLYNICKKAEANYTDGEIAKVDMLSAIKQEVRNVNSFLQNLH